MTSATRNHSDRQGTDPGHTAPTRGSRAHPLAAIAVVALVTLVAVGIAASIQGITASPTHGPNDDVGLVYRYLVTEPDGATPTETLARLDDFKVTEPNSYPTPFGSDVYWHLFEVTNRTDSQSELVLQFENPMLDSIEVYHVDAGQPALVAHLGDDQPDLSLDLRAMPRVEFELGPGESRAYLVRSASSGAAALLSSVRGADGFESYAWASHLLWGGMIITAAVMAAYNAVLFLATRDQLYLHYVGYVMAVLGIIATANGPVYYLAPASVALWLSHSVITLNAWALHFVLRFSLRFLSGEEHVRLTSTPARLLTNIVLGVAILSPFGPEHLVAPIFFILQLASYGLLGVLLYRRLREGAWAILFLISFPPLLIGAAISPMVLTGFAPYTFWTRNALLVGVLLELALISVALASRIRAIKDAEIHATTHDQHHGLPNDVLLDRAIKTAVEAGHRPSLIAVELTGYARAKPYLSPENATALIHGAVAAFHGALDDVQLLPIDPDSPFHGVALLTEGTFAFLADDGPATHTALERLTDLQPFVFESPDLTVTTPCLFGMSTADGSNVDGQQLVSEALLALERARAIGTISHVLEHQEDRSIDGTQIASELQRAIRNRSLQLYHQPQIDLRTGQHLGSEALSRWIHPELGFIPPDEFVAIAEDTGSIHDLTTLVVESAVDHIAALRDIGRPDLSVAINITTQDVMRGTFAEQLVEAVRERGLDPQRIDLVLELTESTLAIDQAVFTRHVQALADASFRLAIDDYGTGYSSLSYVSRLPISKIKVDRSFISELLSSRHDQVIVSATARMAQSLAIDTVAEGIEDARTLEALKAVGYDIGQGYHIARPMPFDDYVTWAKDHQSKAGDPALLP